MSVVTPQALVTAAEALLEMGDIGPCELIDGTIIPLSPTGGEHGRIESNLAFELRRFAEGKQLGWTLSGEVGIVIRKNPDRIRAADVVFVSRARGPGGIPKGFFSFALDLIAEIVSPTDRWQDMRAKLEDYFSIGTESVWVVEPATRCVLVYRSPTKAVKLSKDETLRGEGPLEGLCLPVQRIFAE